MEIRHLEVFCQIVEKKSFSRAARALGLAQPTASGHIRALEEELGVRLFDRLGREVQPTRAGLLLLDYAKRILHTREEACRAIEDYLGIVQGHLDIGASTIPGGYLLPGLLGGFRRLHPDTSVSVQILDSRKVIDGVIEGDFPLGVTGARIQNDQLEFRFFASDDLVLAVPPDHPLAGRGRIRADELNGVEMIVREEGSGTRSVAEERLRDLGFDLDSRVVAAELGDAQGVRSAIRAGLGVSIVSRLSVEEDLGRGTLRAVEIEGFSCTREFYTVIHKARNMSPLCRTFLEFIQKDAS